MIIIVLYVDNLFYEMRFCTRREWNRNAGQYSDGERERERDEGEFDEGLSC